MKFLHADPIALTKRIFWLAYQAAANPFGMGLFQARSNVTEDQVWSNVSTNGDYVMNTNPPDSPYGDYVFGKMMKLGVTISYEGVSVSDSKPRGDYQSWSHAYPTYEDLVNTAIATLAEEARLGASAVKVLTDSGFGPNS